MGKPLLIRLLIIFLLPALISACAGGRLRESSGEYFDSTAITSKVKTSILGAGNLRFFQVSVETFKGTVLLSGFVDSQEIAQGTTEIARTVNGVKLVNNSLIVK